MRELHVSEITQAIAGLVKEANYRLEPDMVGALERARSLEEAPVGQAVLAQLVQNYTIAQTEEVPMCQDTGVALVFLEIGQDLHLVGGDLTEAVNQGVAKGYTEGYLRMSMLNDPLKRVNTRNNTPAFIYTSIVPGDQLRIKVDCKGGGAKRFIVETVAAAGPNACPPLVVGVGIGGNFDKSALLAKQSLLRHVGEPNPDPDWAAREQELLTEINKLGVGPMGLGGTVSALAVHIETFGCHITALPVAVNIECHAHRHKEVVL